MDSAIRDEAKNFVLKIISHARNIDGREKENVLDHEDKFPITELKRDKKFNELFTEIKREFFEGCGIFNS